ncbi:MAG: hypothetical protein ACO3CR_06520 [Solirubrobacterales bacterium]
MNTKKSLILTLPVAALAASALALGSSGCSSKPAFCSNLDSFKQSVNQLVQVEQVNSSTFNEVQNDFNRVEQNANDVVDSAKEDFPQETQNLEDQINATTKAFENLPKNPAAGDYVALGLQVVSLAQAASDFEKKASSSCN